MTIRTLSMLKNLFYKYDELCDKQDSLYDRLILVDDNKKEFNDLQIQKLTILDEMSKYL